MMAFKKFLQYYYPVSKLNNKLPRSYFQAYLQIFFREDGHQPYKNETSSFLLENRNEKFICDRTRFFDELCQDKSKVRWIKSLLRKGTNVILMVSLGERLVYYISNFLCPRS